jgi:osmotically inducible protein OsmC
VTELTKKATVAWKHGEIGLSADPVELFAAAHAGSFSQALSRELGLGRSAPGEIETTVTVTMENQAPGAAISAIHLNVAARLSVTQGAFIDAAVRAKTACAISNILRVKISMNAKLETDLLKEPS